MLTISNISKSFGDNSLFKNFCHDFPVGGIYKLFGQNGVGKTTLLKMIKGMIIPDEGEIFLTCGNSTFESSAYVDTNTRSFFHRLTVVENLQYFLALNKNQQNRNKIYEMAEMFEIGYLLENVFSSLSLGQMQIFSIVRGLLENPKVLLLDEALSGLDKSKIVIVNNCLNEFVKSEDNIVIFCTHQEQSDLKFHGIIEL